VTRERKLRDREKKKEEEDLRRGRRWEQKLGS